jgi:hypothetical protein
MRFRDTLKFALELFVPERLMHPGGSSASDPKPEASQNVPRNLEAEATAKSGKARRIIEELDHGQFGGPSFGPQTIELMSKAGPAASIDCSQYLEGGRRRRARSDPAEGRGDVRPGVGCRHCG